MKGQTHAATSDLEIGRIVSDPLSVSQPSPLEDAV